MTRKLGAFASALFALGFVAYACTSGEVVMGPITSGTAGSSNPGTAGTSNSGVAGTTGQAGNNSSRGGTTGQAGNVGPGQAGVNGRGGTTGQAGTVGPGNAGTFGRGGTTGQAGTTGPGTAGTTGSGTAGTTGSSCPPSFAVATNGFVQMPVVGGCWTGYPYTYADSFGSTVMPAPMAAFTTSMLKLTGNIVAVAGANYSYAGIGFSLGQTSSGETPTLVTPKGSGLNFTFANSTTGGVVLRAQVTNGTTTWCTDVTASGPIAYNAFHITCYNPTPGAAYAKEPIKGIELNLAGGMMAGNINLTLTSVTESP